MIKSDRFGSVALSGDDAKTFARQVQFGRATKAAQATLNLGDRLLQRCGVLRAGAKSGRGDIPGR